MGQEPIEKLPGKKGLKALAREYIDELDKSLRYGREGEAIEWLFETFPQNTDTNEVLIKIMALDSSYSTNLRDLHLLLRIGNEIINTPYFDKRIEKRDLSLVDELCNLKESGLGEGNGKPFSFVSKYCCLQNIKLADKHGKKSKQYAIYDNYVASVLTWYQNNNNFLGVHGRTNLRNKWVASSYKQKTRNGCKVEALKTSYKSLYYPVVICFRHYYGLTSLSLRELDHFLWRMGQEYFLGYKIIKFGDYVIKIRGEEKWEITIYRYAPTARLEDVAKVVKTEKKRCYMRQINESDYDFALRILKDYYVCVRRKEGIIGNYYIELHTKQKTTKIYDEIIDVKVKVKDKSQNDILNDITIEMNKSVKKAVNKGKKDFDENIENEIEALCREIVSKYAENNDEQKQTDENEN